MSITQPQNQSSTSTIDQNHGHFLRSHRPHKSITTVIEKVSVVSEQEIEPIVVKANKTIGKRSKRNKSKTLSVSKG